MIKKAQILERPHLLQPQTCWVVVWTVPSEVAAVYRHVSLTCFRWNRQDSQGSLYAILWWKFVWRILKWKFCGRRHLKWQFFFQISKQKGRGACHSGLLTRNTHFTILCWTCIHCTFMPKILFVVSSIFFRHTVSHTRALLTRRHISTEKSLVVLWFCVPFYSNTSTAEAAQVANIINTRR